MCDNVSPMGDTSLTSHFTVFSTYFIDILLVCPNVAIIQTLCLKISIHMSCLQIYSRFCV